MLAKFPSRASVQGPCKRGYKVWVDQFLASKALLLLLCILTKAIGRWARGRGAGYANPPPPFGPIIAVGKDSTREWAGGESKWANPILEMHAKKS